MTTPLTSEQLSELRSRMLDAGHYGDLGYPSVGALYGLPGTGKTAGMGKLFGRHAVYLGIPKRLVTIPSMTGISRKALWLLETTTVESVYSKIRKQVLPLALKRLKAGKSPVLAVVVDDLTTLADKTQERNAAKVWRTKSGKVDGFGSYNATGGLLYRLMELTRDLPLHIWFTGHPRSPEVNEGKEVEGHFKLPSRNMGINILSAEIGTIVYARKHEGGELDLDEDAEERPFGFNCSFYCGSQEAAGYISRDRLACLPPKGPANIHQMWAETGVYPVTRPPGLEWMDAVVLAMADELTDGESYWDSVRPKALKACQEQGHGQRSPITRWLLSDVADRYRIRLELESELPY